MESSDAFDIPAPTRFSLAGGFAMAVVLASMMHAPSDPFAKLGPLGMFGVDKWVHVGSYALITYLLAYAYLARTARSIAAIVAVSVLLGAGVELIQSTIVWRNMEAADVVANTIGTLGAVAVWEVTWRRLPLTDPQDADGNASGT